MKKKDTKNKYQGEIKPIFKAEPFYMVVVEDSHHPPTVKHEGYEEAFSEALRLSKKENKKAFVLMSVTQVEQIPNVQQFDLSKK